MKKTGNGGRWSTLADTKDTGIWPPAKPIRVEDTIARIDAVIADLDPAHPDTPAVTAELRAAAIPEPAPARPAGEMFQLCCAVCAGQNWMTPDRNELIPVHFEHGMPCWGGGRRGRVVANVPDFAVLQAMQDSVNRIMDELAAGLAAGLGAVTARPIQRTEIVPPPVEIAAVVAETAHTRQWLNRWFHARKGTK